MSSDQIHDYKLNYCLIIFWFRKIKCDQKCDLVNFNGRWNTINRKTNTIRQICYFLLTDCIRSNKKNAAIMEPNWRSLIVIFSIDWFVLCCVALSRFYVCLLFLLKLVTDEFDRIFHNDKISQLNVAYRVTFEKWF